MAAQRSRATTRKKLDVSQLANRSSEELIGGLPSQTLQAMLDKFEPFIPGMIETLGLAAQPKIHEDGSIEPGDLDAAKKALDFLGKVMAGNKADRRGQDILGEIARIRSRNVPNA